MRAAGIVADHATQSAAAVCGRIRAERQSVGLCGRLQRVAHRSRLDQRGARRGIDGNHAVHILREIQHHSHVHALAALRRPATAREDRRPMLATQANRCDYVSVCARKHDPDRNLAIVRSISAVDGPAAGIETHFARDRRGKRRGERCGLHFGLVSAESGLLRGAHRGAHSSRRLRALS